MKEANGKVKQHFRLQRAMDKLREKYGEIPNEIILSRFYRETKYFCMNEKRGSKLDLLIALKERAAFLGEHVYCFGLERASLIAYLFGAIDENPLPLHYFCPKCKKMEYIDEKLLPWDISLKPCDCGGEMRADGFDIPFDSYKNSLIATHVCTSKRFKEEAKEIAGERFEIFSPDNLDTLQMMKEQVGNAPTVDEMKMSDLSLDDLAHILHLFFDIPSSFTKEVFNKTNPQNYYELLKLFGFANSKGAWYDNAEVFMNNGVCKLSEIPVHHEDMLIEAQSKMQEKGIDEQAFTRKVAFYAHYGRYATDGMSEEDEMRLRNLGFEDWFFDYIKKVTFMYSKTHSLVYFKQACELLWYKTNYPDVFNKVMRVLI